MSLRDYYAREACNLVPRAYGESPRDEVGEQGGRAREVKLKWPSSISLS